MGICYYAVHITGVDLIFTIRFGSGSVLLVAIGHRLLKILWICDSLFWGISFIFSFTGQKKQLF